MLYMLDNQKLIDRLGRKKREDEEAQEEAIIKINRFRDEFFKYIDLNNDWRAINPLEKYVKVLSDIAWMSSNVPTSWALFGGSGLTLCEWRKRVRAVCIGWTNFANHLYIYGSRGQQGCRVG